MLLQVYECVLIQRLEDNKLNGFLVTSKPTTPRSYIVSAVIGTHTHTHTTSHKE